MIKPKTKYWYSLAYRKVIVSTERPRGRYRPATYEEVCAHLIDEQFEHTHLTINWYKNDEETLRIKT